MAVARNREIGGSLGEVAKAAAKDGFAGQAREFKRDLPPMETSPVVPTSGGRANQQMFANALVKKEGAKNSAAEANVLNNFQLEQNGNQIRIVDNDGSVYEGALLADARDEEAAQRKLNRAVLLAGMLAADADKKTLQPLDYEKQTRQNFRFAASGTNLSLRQRVTIDGELLLSNSRVIGRATVADGQRVELNAAELPLKK